MFRTYMLPVLVLLLLWPCASWAAGRVNCFIYHRFDEFRYPSTNISSEVFRAQLDYLREQGYPLLSHGEVVRRLLAGEDLPQRAASLSVDDAFQSFLEVAMPLIREYQVPITLFVNTDSVGTPGYLDWEQLHKLHEEGVEIGNHTASHAYLVEMQKGESREAWRQRIKQEISLAQNAFAEHLGIQPTLFAYPYGEYIPELFDILGELGFSSAYAQQSGVIHSGQNPYLLPRFPMGGPFATLDGFKSKLGMRPLLVDTEEPLSPLLEADNPPILKIQLDPSQKGLLNCFVQGDNRCRAVPISDQPGWYQVEADQPLAGRRNKYTLTMQDRQGNWHWYSHLWVNAKEPAGDY